eukprot:5738001-Pleurochrysis_carterae.AAC.3
MPLEWSTMCILPCKLLQIDFQMACSATLDDALPTAAGASSVVLESGLSTAPSFSGRVFASIRRQRLLHPYVCRGCIAQLRELRIALLAGQSSAGDEQAATEQTLASRPIASTRFDHKPNSIAAMGTGSATGRPDRRNACRAAAAVAHEINRRACMLQVRWCTWRTLAALSWAYRSRECPMINSVRWLHCRPPRLTQKFTLHADWID